MARNRRRSAVVAVATSAAATMPLLASCGSGQPEAREAEPHGKQVFITAGCGACHTLRDVGSTGRVGPDLDRIEPEVEHVELFVTTGGVGMPAFEGVLTPADIEAVSRYVADVTSR